jgi:acetoin utilization deacetylase AcuC-like enzyme/GNAT superfamily N-acetyltransferase
MSDPRSARPPAQAAAGASRWRVRAAGQDDVQMVAAAVRELLIELDGVPGELSAMQAAASALIDTPSAGAVLVAEAEGELVGVLAASWQTAIHVAGAYALIQDLWVRPDWRNEAIGKGLLDALFALARSKRLARVEVGLPRESFARFAATERFYLSNGFAPNGRRMRWYPPASGLLMIEQQAKTAAVQPWLLSRAGVRLQGHDHDRRLSQLRTGLARHPAVRSAPAETSAAEVEFALGALHDRAYLRALARVRREEPVLMAQFAAPGMAPDTPVCASVAEAAYEGVRTAIVAAKAIARGERFAYALCRPPGHHAGPGWLGGCCYLNNAAAAAHTLRDSGVGPVAILDLDIHYPNGTAAMVERMEDTRLHSLHCWPVVNVASQSAQPHTERERFVEFRRAPAEEHYLGELAESIDVLGQSAAAIVLSLGYDTVRGDPHGCWQFSPEIFVEVGRLLAGSQLPVCIVQEGGYALASLADCGYAFARGLLGGEKV